MPKLKGLYLLGFTLLVAIVLYVLLDYLPTYRTSLPGDFMDKLNFVVVCAFFIFSFLWVANKLLGRKWAHFNRADQILSKLSYWGFVALLLLLIIMFTFPYAYNARDTLDPKAITSKSTVSYVDIKKMDIDRRCEFFVNNDQKNPYYILNYNGRLIFTKLPNDINVRLYGYLDPEVKYFDNKKKAITLGNDNNGTFLRILDLENCTVRNILEDFEYDTSHFQLSFNEISEDGKYIVFNFSYGFLIPVFPDNEVDYTKADAAKNGIWLYNDESKETYQLLQIPVSEESWDYSVTIDQNSLRINGESCQINECEFDLEKY